MYCQYEVVEEDDIEDVIDDDEVEAEMLYKQLLKQTYEIVIVFVYEQDELDDILVVLRMVEILNLIILLLLVDELDEVQLLFDIVIFGVRVYDVLEVVDEVVYQLLLKVVDVRYLDEKHYENDVTDDMLLVLEADEVDDLEVLDVIEIYVAEVIDETEHHQTLVEKLLFTDEDEQDELECMEYDELDDEVEVTDEIVDVFDVIEVIDDDEVVVDTVEDDETDETEWL